MFYLMDLTLTTNITSRDSLVGDAPDTNRFSVLKRNKETNTNRVLIVPLPVFSMLGNSNPGPTRTQLEIRKDREISTRVHLKR